MEEFSINEILDCKAINMIKRNLSDYVGALADDVGCIKDVCDCQLSSDCEPSHDVRCNGACKLLRKRWQVLH